MSRTARGRRMVLVVLLLAAIGTGGAAAARRHAHAPISKPTWLTGVEVTEYYPVPERWFVGARVQAPGLPGRYRVDWLYSARGLSVEGDGIDLAGNRVHVASLGRRHGYIDAQGHRTSFHRLHPFWLSGGYWLTATHQPTFPLESGGWANGTGVRYRPLPDGLRFAPGPSLALEPYRSLAVDPHLIPLGSRVYIPAYKGIDGATGWFVAQDTGSAIRGHHVDVFRAAPPTIRDARLLTGQRVLVVPPGAALPPELAGGAAAPGR